MRPVRIQPNPRRVRVLVDDVAVADTHDSIDLFETGHTPVYYLPKTDVRFDLLEPTDHTSFCPRKGNAVYWSIVIGDRRVENAVWSYPEPLPDTDDLSAYVSFYWSKVDRWFEDDDEIFAHPRQPTT